jgi:hypothetical protein
MIHRLAALAFLALLAVDPASACPPPSDTLLFHSCWGQGRLAIRLLPEDLPLPEPADAVRRLTVTGAYTGRENRDGGRPKPVGMFVHGGVVTNPNLGRMDGVLLVDPATGEPELQHRARLRLGGRDFDLRLLDQRRAFLAEAVVRGLSVLQSHLLIVDGQVDVRPQDDAPVFVRRMFFTDETGFGIYQTVWPKTLQDAARQLADALAPRMALNLDMGSYNYCQRVEDGVESSCGGLDRNDTGKLSNLLLLTLE